MTTIINVTVVYKKRAYTRYTPKYFFYVPNVAERTQCTPQHQTILQSINIQTNACSNTSILCRQGEQNQLETKRDDEFSWPQGCSPDSEDDLLEPEVEDENLHNLLFFFFSVVILYVVQLLSCVRLFATPWTAAHQASLSFTISLSLLKLCPLSQWCHPNIRILYCPLLLLPSVFPGIRVFISESAVRIRWPKYWSFSFSISPSNEYSGLISFRMDWLDLLAA